MAALTSASLAACSSNKADNQQNDSTSQSSGAPAAADSAVKANSQPVDTATKDSTQMQDTMRR